MHRAGRNRRTLGWDWRAAEDAYRTTVALCQPRMALAYAQFRGDVASAKRKRADRVTSTFCLLVTTSAGGRYARLEVHRRSIAASSARHGRSCCRLAACWVRRALRRASRGSGR